LQELKLSIRSLIRAKAQSLVIILTLGLGVGSTVTVYSLMDGVVLSPLPYPNPEMLVQVDHAAPAIHLDSLGVSVPLFEYYRKESRTFEDLALYQDLQVTLAEEGRAERVAAARVTSSIFRVLGVGPKEGRAFLEEEGELGSTPVVIVGHGLWQSQFGGVAYLVGRNLGIDGVVHQVVGIMPRGFSFPSDETALWLPRVFSPDDQRVGNFSDRAIGRLAGGEDLGSAQVDVRRLAGHLDAAFPGEGEGLAETGLMPVLESRLDTVVGQARTILWVLFAAVSLILAIAAANVANLYLIRIEERRNELAVRHALGANRGILIRDLLWGSVALAIVAGGLGLGIASLAVKAIVSTGAGMIPRLGNVTVQGSSALLALAVSLCCGVLIGILPALRGTRESSLGISRTRSSTAGLQRQRLRSTLVVSQLALGLVLAVSCSLVVRSFVSLQAVDPGFEAQGTLSFRTILPDAEFSGPAARAALIGALNERLRQVPGVAEVGMATYLPLSGIGSSSTYRAEGLEESAGPVPASRHTFVSSGYMEAMNIPLLAGRTFTDRDHRSEAPKVMVSEGFAERLWGHARAAVGKRITGVDPTSDQWYEIVGVVGNVKLFRLDEPVSEFVYLPLVGHPAPNPELDSRTAFVVRTDRSAAWLLPQIRAIVTDLNPTLAVSSVQSLEALVQNAQASLSFAANLLVASAAMALLIAAVGLYGTISFLVGQRRKEIGIRLALGAQRGQILTAVLRQGLLLAAAGIGIGLVLALLVTRGLASMLYDVGALDPLSFAFMPLLLLLIAGLASLLPAAKASRVEPLVALARD